MVVMGETRLGAAGARVAVNDLFGELTRRGYSFDLRWTTPTGASAEGSIKGNAFTADVSILPRTSGGSLIQIKSKAPLPTVVAMAARGPLASLLSASIRKTESTHRA